MATSQRYVLEARSLFSDLHDDLRERYLSGPHGMRMIDWEMYDLELGVPLARLLSTNARIALRRERRARAER